MSEQQVNIEEGKSGNDQPANPDVALAEDFASVRIIPNDTEYEKYREAVDKKTPSQVTTEQQVPAEDTISENGKTPEGEGGSGLPPEQTPEGGAEAASSAQAADGGSQEPPTQPQTEAPDAGLSDEDYFKALSEQTGYKIENDDQIIQTINFLKKQAEEAIPKNDLSPVLQEAIEYEKKGGDVRKLFEVMSIDVDKTAPRDALRQKFMLENAEIAKSDPEYAQMKFEREYENKYAILSQNYEVEDFENESDYYEWKRQKEFAQKEFDYETSRAKESLKGMKESALKEIPEKKNGLSEEELIRIRQDYLKSAEDYANSFDVVEFSIDPEGKDKFNIGLNDQTRPLFDDWIRNPHKFYEYIGIPADGKTVDMEKFGAHLALTAMLAAKGENSIGYLLKKYLQENADLDTIEKKVINPKGESSSAPPAADDERLKALEELGRMASGSYRPYYYPKE